MGCSEMRGKEAAAEELINIVTGNGQRHHKKPVRQERNTSEQPRHGSGGGMVVRKTEKERMDLEI